MPTVTSAEQIVNIALARLGNNIISAIGESTKAGKLAGVLYAPTRDAVLRSHPWNFAVKRADLASSDDDEPLFEYGYGFPLPSDFLRLIRTEVEAEGVTDDYRIEAGDAGSVLLSNDDAVSIEYIARITDVTRFDSLFVQVLALSLAIAFAPALSDNASLLKTLQEELKDISPGARTTDAQEGTPRAHVTDDWVLSRL